MTTRYSAVSCLLAALLCVAQPGLAEPPPARLASLDPSTTRDSETKSDLEEPATVAKERARLLYEKGVTAYRESRFYDAVDIFLETNRLYPDPKFSYNIGKAFEGMGNQAGALRYYRDYLRQLPEAPDAEDVEKHVHGLERSLNEKGIQQLTVLSTPSGATLKLDGQAVGVTPWTGETFAGKHRLAIDATSYRPLEAVVEVDPHRARDFSFELPKAPDPACVDVKLAHAPPQTKPELSLLTLGTLGTGLALLGTALIAQVASHDEAAGISRTAAFFSGAGTGVTLAGGILLYFDLSPGNRSAARAAVNFGGEGLEHGMSR